MIRYYIFWNKTFTQTKLDSYYGESAPQILTLKNLLSEFRCGRISMSGSKLSEHTIAVAKLQTIEIIRSERAHRSLRNITNLSDLYF